MVRPLSGIFYAVTVSGRRRGTHGVGRPSQETRVLDPGGSRVRLPAGRSHSGRVRRTGDRGGKEAMVSRATKRLWHGAALGLALGPVRRMAGEGHAPAQNTAPKA